MSSRVRESGVRSPYDKVGDLFYFGRMLDKIRSFAKGELPLEYQVNLGKGFDKKCVTFLRVRYELVVDYVNYGLSDDAVLESLGGLAGAIEPDGFLIYTNQPWHPQLEFIARVLRNREGKRWIMRRRTTAEIDELVRMAGFEKCAMEIDRWGMFTVAVARRTLS